jgi:PilZ domain
MDARSVAPHDGELWLAAQSTAWVSRFVRAGYHPMDTSRDRRKFARRPFRARVTVSLPSPQISVEAHVLDISLNGVRLICADPLCEGQDAVLTFRIRTRKRLQIEEVAGRVVHARMDDDAWVVGLKFDQVLTPESTPLLAEGAMSRRKRR